MSSKTRPTEGVICRDGRIGYWAYKPLTDHFDGMNSDKSSIRLTVWPKITGAICRGRWLTDIVATCISWYQLEMGYQRRYSGCTVLGKTKYIKLRHKHAMLVQYDTISTIHKSQKLNQLLCHHTRAKTSSQHLSWRSPVQILLAAILSHRYQRAP